VPSRLKWIRPISQSYLSQIESGARPHLTNTTRLLLAKFFKVHPGYLVEDPEGYHAELLSDIRTQEEKLDLWLIAGSDRFRKDPELCRALRAVALYPDSRRSLLLLESVLETPVLMERLLEILRPSEHQPNQEDPTKPGKHRTTRNSVK
jgi:transcriptional regulator with XRE-family HTH domain